MQNYSEQVADVYGALNNAADSEGDEELDQVMSMQRSSAAQPRSMMAPAGGARQAQSMAMPM